MGDCRDARHHVCSPYQCIWALAESWPGQMDWREHKGVLPFTSCVEREAAALVASCCASAIDAASVTSSASDRGGRFTWLLRCFALIDTGRAWQSMCQRQLYGVTVCCYQQAAVVMRSVSLPSGSHPRAACRLPQLVTATRVCCSFPIRGGGRQRFHHFLGSPDTAPRPASLSFFNF